MTDEAPPHWEVERRRTYTPAGVDRSKEYVTYRHESGDLRLRVAPAALDGDDYPGYALTATTYPGLDMGDSFSIRRVLTYDRCVSIAERFMELFAARYDGPGELETALEYAHDRVRASDASDELYTLNRDGAGGAGSATGSSDGREE